MDTWKAIALGKASRGHPLMVFDWNKAAQLILESGSEDAAAGLRDDWGYTGGAIFEDGKPVSRDDTYVYLASTWAVPEIEIDGVKQPCWQYEDKLPEWDAHTYWPESALAILRGEE